MNLTELFGMQKKLDKRIIKEKGLEGQDLLLNKVLALQVELGELANEWQGFKHWKVNPKPKKGMLEEYVDCLHFLLSIGLDIKMTYITPYSYICPLSSTILEAFTSLIADAEHFLIEDDRELTYTRYFCQFIGLGEMLGFTWEQVVQAYKDKNEVNHQRQENGY